MAAQVKKYDPNQYNFGDFAKTMNNNFSIERAQNGQGGAFGVNGGINPANPVNLGGTTNSQTLGNLDANGVGAVGVNAGGVGNLSDVNTVGQAKPLVGRDMFRGITNSFFDTLKANGAGTSMTYSSPLVPKTPESSPTVQKVEADIPEKSDQVRNIYAIMNASGGNKSLGDWIGELSGSYNEDDIRSAYSQHLSAVSQAPIFNGGGEAQVSQGGSTLSFEDWQSAYSIDPTVEYQNAQAQLDYEFKTWMSDYGARAEQLYQMGLSNSGVSDIYGANAYTAYVQASMDLKRAQIQQQAENKRAYQEYLDGIEAQQSAVTSAAFNSYAASYTPAQEQSVRVALAAQGLSAEQVESAIAQLNNYYNSLPEDQRPDVVAGNARADEAFTWLSQQYAAGVTDINTLTAQVKALYGEDVGAKAAERFMPFVQGNVANDTLINDAAIRIATTIFTDAETGTSTYTGSESQKNYIRQLMQLSEYSDLAPYVEEIIAKMDENLAVQKDVEVSDIVSNYEKIATDESWLSNPSTSTMANYISGIEQYKQQYGVNSKEYKDALAAGSASIKDYILAATDSESMLDDAGAWLGVDFAEMDTADKFNAVLDGAGKLHRDGYMTDEDYESIINTWLNGQLLNAETSDNPFFDLSQKLERLTEYYENYNLNPRVYDGMRRKITKNIEVNNVRIANASGTKVTKVYINCSVNDKALSVEATYRKVNKDDQEYVSYLVEKNGPDSLFAWGDNIYYADDSGKVFVLTSFSFFGAANAGSGSEANRVKTQLLLAAVNSQTK